MRKALRTGVLGKKISTLFHRFRFLAECYLFALINNTSSSWHIQTGSIQVNFMGHWAILVPFSIKTKGYIILSILSFQKARKEVVDIIVNVSKKTTAAVFLLKWSTAFGPGHALEAHSPGCYYCFSEGKAGIRSFGLPLVCSPFLLSMFLVGNLAAAGSAHSWCDTLGGLVCCVAWRLSILEMSMISISKGKTRLVGN